MSRSLLLFAAFAGFLFLCNGCGGGGSSPVAPTTVAGAATLGFTVGSAAGHIGDTVAIPVTLDTNSATRAVACTITFTPAVAVAGESAAGSIRDAGATLGSGVACRRTWNTGSVTLLFAGTGVTHTIATLPFRIVGAGTTALTITNVTAYDATMQPVIRTARIRHGYLSAR